MKLQWYKTNFSKDLVFKDKKTTFLRVENIIPEGIYTESKDNIWVTVIPESSGDQFKLNIIDASVLKADIDSKAVTDSSLFNLLGDPNLANLEGFTYPRADYWRLLEPGKKTDFRVDFEGSENDILKLTFLFTTINPVNFDTELPVFNPGTPKLGDVSETASPGFYEVHTSSSTSEEVAAEKMNFGAKAIHETFSTIVNSSIFFGTDQKFDYKEVYIVGYEKQSSNSTRNYGNWTKYPKSVGEIVNDKTSYGLVKTNPKLSGNIKLTVDKYQDLWLDTIDANSPLADSKLKRFQVDPSSSYPSDLKQFLAQGNVPPNILFDLYQEDELYENTKTNLYEQHDMFYAYGAQQLNDEYYEEDLSFFAPIWLKKELPEYFVIFKVENPLSLKSYNDENRDEIVKEILSSAQLIKTYDLRTGTKIGKYLRSITENSRFIEQPLNVNYAQDLESTWTGIDYKSGVLTSKSEYLFEKLTTDMPIKEFEEYVTEGFERNQMICANLVNLSFLFDDETTDFYEINRYMGFYVNAIELASFGIDKKGFGKIPGQTPDPKENKDGEQYSLQAFLQQNDNGIIVPIDDNKLIGKIPLADQIDDLTRFFVISDRKGLLKRIVGREEYTYGIEDTSSYYNFTGLKLLDDVIDFSNFLGITEISQQLEGTYLESGPSQMKIELEDFIAQGEIYRISMSQGLIHHVWEIEANDNGLEIGDFWSHPTYNISDNKDKTTFSTEGELYEVAKSVAGAFNSFSTKLFYAYAKDTTIYFITKNKNEEQNTFNFERLLVTGSDANSIKFYGIQPNFTIIEEETENTCGLKYEIDPDKLDQLSGQYTAIVSDFMMGSPSTNLMKIKVYRDDGSVALDKYITVGDSVMVDFFLTFYTDDVTSDGQLVLTVIEVKSVQSFLGGCGISKQRVKIDKNKAPNLTEKDWFQIQFEKFDKLLSYDVQGQKMFYLPYLDEPILEDELIQSFSDIDEYAIIQNETENLFIYLTSEKRITSFNVFECSLNVLSFLNVKEFDFDFIKSDYAYSPLLELERYFGEIQNGFSLQNGKEYDLRCGNFFLKTGDAHIKLYGFDNSWELIQSESADPFLFNTLSPNIAITNTNDFKASFDSSYTKFKIKVTSGSGTLSNFSYFQDVDLNNFKGFSTLRDFWDINDEYIIEELKKTRSFSRFLHKMLLSEYDRLGENYVKKYATTSKVVPYINKWVQEGTDARDNKYRLNVSAAFGYTNLSPDYFAKDTDPHSLTHEWNYLDRIPLDYDDESVANSRSYFFDSLDGKPVLDVTNSNYDKTWLELLKGDDVDWFTKYFIVGYPTEKYENTLVVKGKDERYTTLTYDPLLDETYGLFRGAKFKLTEIDEKGNKVALSSIYDGYKFASILSLTDDSIRIETEVIDNRKFKTLLVVTRININDYKLNGNLDYTTLYSTISAKRNIQMIDTDVSPILLTKEEARTDDELSNNGNLTDLGEKNYLDNQLERNFVNNRGGAILDYSDVNLLSKLIMGSYTKTSIPDTDPQDYNVELLFDTTYLDQLGLTLKSEVKNVNSQLPISFFKNQTYMFGTNSGATEETFLQLDPIYFENYNISSFSSLKNNWPSGGTLNKNPLSGVRGETSTTETFITENTLTIKGRANINYTYAVINNLIKPTSEREMLYPLSISSENSETFYINGGFRINATYLNEISFTEIYDRLENSPNLNYTTIDDETTSTKLFKIEFIEFDAIQKDGVNILDYDDEKPVEYVNVDKIGFVDVITDSSEQLYRHRGKHEPKTRKILDFWAREDDEFTDYYETDFLGTNTKFLTNHRNFGIILNSFSNKVADSEIMKISRTSKFKSLYPLIDEVTIYPKDIFTFSSNWDKDYYDYFTSLRDSHKIDGTSELKECKSFFGSKAMRVPKTFEFETFEANELVFISSQPKRGLELKLLTKTTESEIKKLSDIVEITSLKSDSKNPKFDIVKKDGQSKLGVSLDYFEKIIGQPIKLSSVPVEDTKVQLSISVDLNKRLIREMIEEGATNEFNWMRENGVPEFANLTDDEISKKTQDYLLKNITNLYEISEIKMFSKDSENDEPIFVMNLTTEEQETLGYEEEKGFQIKNETDLTLELQKQLDSKNYKTYTLSVSIQRV